MTSVVSKLCSKQLIVPPSFLKDSIQYETITGSDSYGVWQGGHDTDVVGFCIPPKDMIFPHIRGEIPGFGNQIKRFEQYQQHHILDTDGSAEYDITIYSIVKYFQLCMENNPNMLDTLFTPVRCILSATPIAEHVRSNRKVFIHKGLWHKFKGYAYSQLHKVRTKNPKEGSKRIESVRKFGWDTKFGYHLVRLLLEAEQLLKTGDMDLELHKEFYRSIRTGEVSMEEVELFFKEKETSLEKVYEESSLPHYPPEQKIKTLLLECLEMYFGNINDCLCLEQFSLETLRSIKQELDKFNGKVLPYEKHF